MKKINVFMIIVLLCFWSVACGTVDSTDNYEDKAEVTENSVVTETQTVAEPMPYESCNQLKSAINMMVIYDFSYSDLPNTPNDEFWEKFSSSLLCNSWYDGFGYLSQEFGTTMWDNEKIAYAGSLLTGKELTCERYPEGLDISMQMSPYAQEWEQENISIETLKTDCWKVSFDFTWSCCTLDKENGKKKVAAIVVTNENSPFDGYSIESLEIDTIVEPKH